MVTGKILLHSIQKYDFASERIGQNDVNWENGHFHNGVNTGLHLVLMEGCSEQYWELFGCSPREWPTGNCIRFNYCLLFHSANGSDHEHTHTHFSDHIILSLKAWSWWWMIMICLWNEFREVVDLSRRVLMNIIAEESERKPIAKCGIKTRKRNHHNYVPMRTQIKRTIIFI